MSDDAILMYVSHGCSCESYYRYVCGLCRTPYADLERLRDEGLVCFDEGAPTYHTRWRLTSAGRARYQPAPIRNTEGWPPGGVLF